MKPAYSIDAPDQQRLKVARLEIEAVLKKHDLAGVVALHTPGMVFYDVRPSYSCAWVDEAARVARFLATLADYNGDATAQLHDIAATANMTRCLAGQLLHAAGMFQYIASMVDRATRAKHVAHGYVPDPMQTKPQ